MKFSAFFSVAVTLLCHLIVAEDKHRCPPHDPIKAALLAQAEYELNLRLCKYRAAAQMTTTNFSYSLIEPSCASGEGQTCCVSQGAISQLLSRYVCGDTITYLERSLDNVKLLKNGTVVINKYEVIVHQDLHPQITNYNFFWNPSGDGKYWLNYVDGNDFACPTYLYGLGLCGYC